MSRFFQGLTRPIPIKEVHLHKLQTKCSCWMLPGPAGHRLITRTDWKLNGNLKLQHRKGLKCPYVVGVAWWHAPGGI